MDAKKKQPPLFPAPALYHPDGKENAQMSITSLSIEGEFYIAQAFLTYTFTFKNTSKKKLTGLFAFPTEGTVTHFEAVFNNGRVIDTAVVASTDLENMKKQKPKGKKGDEQLAQLATGVPDLFRVPVQDIPKNEEFRVTVRVLETLEFRQDQRYHLDLKTAFPKGVCTGVVSIQLQIHVGFPRELFYASDTHNISFNNGTVANQMAASHYLSLTAKSAESTDLRFAYYMPSTEIMGALLQQEANPYAWDQRGSFMLLLTPPSHTAAPFPRDVIFLVDRSGSMGGDPFKQASAAVASAMSTLNPQTDTFSLVMYDHEFKTSMAANGMLQQATQQNIGNAIAHMNRNQPRGGTNIREPLLWALDTLRRASAEAPQRKSVKSVVLITDGCVAGERDIVRAVRGVMQNEASRYTRIHTIGLGPYCNHQFLKMLALVGRGFNENIINMEQEGIVQRRTLRLMFKMSNPVLSNVTLGMQAQGVELYPFPIPDLFKGAPLVVAGKYSGQFPASITVNGIMPDGKTFTKTIMTSKSAAIPVDRVFAKSQIDDLTAKFWETEDQKIQERIIELSVQQSMPSAYTTVVAYETTEEKREKEQKEEKKQGKGKKPSAGKAAAVGALAVGGVLAIGAGVYLLGGSGAISATANGLSSAGSAIGGGVERLFGEVGDCCGGCCNGLFGSMDGLCGSLEPVFGCCGDACGCINDTPLASCGDICGNVCDSCLRPLGECCGPALEGCCGQVCEFVGQGTSSCGDIIQACNPGSIGDLLGSCGSLTSIGDVCTDINLGSIGDLCGSIGSVGDVCKDCDFGSIIDICNNIDFSSCAEICAGICEVLTKIK